MHISTKYTEYVLSKLQNQIAAKPFLPRPFHQVTNRQIIFWPFAGN